MKHQTIIQKLIACCLLLVFATGSAPRAFFHEVFADHEDVPGCTIDHESAVLHPVQVHCDFDDLVVPASYLVARATQLENPVVFIDKARPVLIQSIPAIYMQYRESRGPPSA